MTDLFADWQVPAVGLTGSPLDRADRLRNDVEGFNAALNDWRARVLGLGLSWDRVVETLCR